MRGFLTTNRPLVSGAISLNSATPAATAERSQGWAYDSTGKMYATSAGAAVPATAVLRYGLAFTPLGALYVTDTAFAATAIEHQGFRIRLDGALHVNSGAIPATATKINGVSVAAGRLHETGV